MVVELQNVTQQRFTQQIISQWKNFIEFFFKCHHNLYQSHDENFDRVGIVFVYRALQACLVKDPFYICTFATTLDWGIC